MRRKWTKEELEYVKLNYSDRYTKDIADAINRSPRAVYQAAINLNVRKSPEFIKISLEREAEKLKILGAASRFKPGNISHNKGQKMSKEMYEKCKKTFFTKGHKPANTKLKGDERMHEGYTYVKIEDRNWRLKHRLIYENVHGPIPADSIVIFKDNNLTNFDINNLEVITKAENMLRNTIHQYPEPIQQIIKLNNKLKKQINAKQN
jgi:hypothetical protein